MKNSLKTSYFSISWTFKVLQERSSAVFVMINSKSVSICNHSYARLVYSSRNHVFWRGYANLMPSYGVLLELRGSKLVLLIYV